MARIEIDLDNLNEQDVYSAFGVEGKEAEALNDSYLELYELIGRDAMLKLFKHYRVVVLTVRCGCIDRIM